MHNDYQDSVQSLDFDAIRLRVASPDDIHHWSHGEVTRPETINYRTQKPEKDGLFSERIFGPTKDWECYCGKYKKVRYKGIVCDKCGVEVTRSIVRRERMGHIDLAAPVSHIWFLRGVPSKIGTVLDMSVMALEKVMYFANFIVTDVQEESRQEAIDQLRNEYKQQKKQIDEEAIRQIEQVRKDIETKEGSESAKEKELEKALQDIQTLKEQTLLVLDEKVKMEEEELKTLKVLRTMSEETYRELSLKYGHLFEAGIGAEAIHKLLGRVDLEKLATVLDEEIEDSQGVKREKLIRRSKLVRSLVQNGIRPEWMVMTVVPIIPPDLRPMVALDGGRFATSDLNDLYRRVINRNNRLKQLVELKAPEVICRNEKRMLQEAVDALIDNSARHGKTVVASTGQKRMLKSLADMLKGKRGRFRQNLLGKRIDYSGRSVIVVGPTLKLHQCGLPKTMALELFKPFVISQLIKREYVYNVRSASRFIESGRTEVWDILEEIVKDSYVLLNRAPTLHRLGIQAFKPVLIEGKAIQIHPLVCSAYNADFDGDQMAVHVPLSDEAKAEAEGIMLASRNILKPATGDPIANPNQDIVWGAFYMTFMPPEEEEKKTEALKYFSDDSEALLAYSTGFVGLQQKIRVRTSGLNPEKVHTDETYIETTSGRLLFNRLLPNVIPFQNVTLAKKNLGEIISLILDKEGIENTAEVLDAIKETCFKYLTRSGLSFGMGDVPVLPGKAILIAEAEDRISETEEQYLMGLLTHQERKSRIITIWSEARDKIYAQCRNLLGKDNSIYSIIESGARGTWAQLNQVIGMKGLMASPSGEIIELAVKSSFKEGLTVLEFFISTHGARKGLSDTALRTSNAGYLTRRLVDVAQDIVIMGLDCKDTEGVLFTKKGSDAIDVDFYTRLIGRIPLKNIENTAGDVIAKKNEIILRPEMQDIKDARIEEVVLRSPLTCREIHGICRKCYGLDLARNGDVELGTAVGIIAAQSLGEPCTQLTMRTFHTGGVAGVSDITQGLPRVEELFETRPPKAKAVMAEVSGRVSITHKQKTVVAGGKEVMQTQQGQKTVSIAYDDTKEDVYKFMVKGEKKVEDEGGEGKKKKKRGTIDVKVDDKQHVMEGDVLFVTDDGLEIAAKHAGTAHVEKQGIRVLATIEAIKEYVVPQHAILWVKDGDMIEAGDQITEGSLDLQMLFRYKGRNAAQKYIIDEIQHIYSSQGQKINDKHIEVIVRQMFSRTYITETGDTELLPGEIIERSEFLDANKAAEGKGGAAAQGEELLMGITKASLSTRSWLSAASFQETARILINAAVTGKIDHLEGLKENVIIGRLIPVGTGYGARPPRIQ